MPTESAQKVTLMTNIAVAQFFLTIVLVVISDPNLVDSSLFGSHNEGGSTDLNVKWYSKQGGILINSMFMWSFWPVINLFIDWLILTILRTYDTHGSTADAPKTRQLSIQRYISLHAGPRFSIEYAWTVILI